MKKILFAFILLLLFFGCKKDIVNNSNENTNFTEGKKLYFSKCGGCHNYYKRENYTSDEWEKIMLVMQKKAKINDKEKDNILNYLKENSKQNISNN